MGVRVAGCGDAAFQNPESGFSSAGSRPPSLPSGIPHP